MFIRIYIVIASLVFLSSQVSAQVSLETGFFLNDPENEVSSKTFNVKLHGGEEQGRPISGISMNVGRLILGLETLNNRTSFSNSVTGHGDNGGTLSSGFVSIVGPTHRAMMGLRLTRNVALYGFHGLAGYSVNHDLSYNSKMSVQGTDQVWHTYTATETRQDKCGRWVSIEVEKHELVNHDIQAMHTSTAFSSGNFDGLQNTVGAGMEAFLFGGLLRVEYNLIHTNGFTQTAKLQHSTSNVKLQNTNTQESYKYQWQGSTDQLIQLRWKKQF